MHYLKLQYVHSEHQEPQKCLAKPSSEHEMPCPQWKQVQLLLSWCNSTIHTLCELATLSSTRSFMYWWTEISTAIEMLWSRDGSQSTFHWIKLRSSTTQTKGLRHKEYSKGICQLYLQSVPQVLHWFLIPITGSTLNAENIGSRANKSVLRRLLRAIGKFVSTDAHMYVVCATALSTHVTSEFRSRGLYRHVYIT